MDRKARVELLERLARGGIALRDLAGLERKDLDTLAHLGRVAYESKKFEQAARIFAGLEALEPGVPIHILRRAHAESAAGRKDDASTSATRYLDLELHRPPEDLVEALLLRATLRREADPAAAADDVRAAEILAERSPAARALLRGGSR